MSDFSNHQADTPAAEPHKSRKGFFFVFIPVGLVVAAISAIAGQAHKAGQAVTGTTPAVAQHQTVTYVVTGTKGGDVTYGSAGTELAGKSPMRITKPLADTALYQLSVVTPLTGGHVGCELLVDGKVIASERASGAGNLADCMITRPMDGTKWTDPLG